MNLMIFYLFFKLWSGYFPFLLFQTAMHPGLLTCIEKFGENHHILRALFTVFSPLGNSVHITTTKNISCI